MDGDFKGPHQLGPMCASHQISIQHNEHINAGAHAFARLRPVCRTPDYFFHFKLGSGRAKQMYHISTGFEQQNVFCSHDGIKPPAHIEKDTCILENYLIDSVVCFTVATPMRNSKLQLLATNHGLQVKRLR
jgi:hypothetical protein